MLAATATALVSLAACGPGDSGKGRKGKSGSDSSSSDSSGSSSSGTGSSKKKPKTGSDTLQLGEAATETLEIEESGDKAEFQITMEKIVTGKAADLSGLQGDKKDYEGKVPAWLYSTYKHVGGAAPFETISVDANMMMDGGQPATPLILIGDLPAKPKDCVEISDVKFQQGDSKTVCKIFLVPEGEQVEEVQLSRGFSSPPTTWEAD